MKLNRFSAAVIFGDDDGRPRPFKAMVFEPALEPMVTEEADLAELVEGEA